MLFYILRRRTTSGKVDTHREAKEIKRENVAREKSFRKEKQNPVKSHHFVIMDAESKRNHIPRSDSLFSVWIFFFII